ncbi:MAG: hypothetical protein H0U03_10305 [Actinobacteria bacterium]|nr:hypothetical protein [Actinomycetota bacterium]
MNVRRSAPAVALATAVACFVSPASATREIVVPSRVQVVATEFQLALSRRTIKSGRAVVELVNYGEDDHDLRMLRLARGAKMLKIRTVLPGDDAQLRATLAPGKFVLWCSIADHRKLGMEARLTVTKRT